MATERYVVLGLARVRAPWFAHVSRWATSAALPVDFVKAVSVEEVRARLASGRAFSALLVDGGLAAVDRDLVDRACGIGAQVIVVTDGRIERDWAALGVAAVLPPEFTRDELQRALADHATPIGRSDRVPGADEPSEASPVIHGSLIAVTGSGGVGSSTTSIALAQGLADQNHLRDNVALVDFDLDADQAMLHDARDVVPGLLELVDAHRSSQPTTAEIRSLTFAVLERHYHLLLGLRRHRDWTALRPRAFEAALAGLRQSYRAVVADVGPDVEGEQQCGSVDVEERNLIARTTFVEADLVLVVGRAGMQGLHAQLRVIRELLGHGVDCNRILPVINHAPRQARVRAELSRAFGELVTPSHGELAVASPNFMPERRGVEDAVRDGVRLPDQITRPVTTAVTVALDRIGSSELPPIGGRAEPEPVAVQPGSLGSWFDDGPSE